MRVRVDVCLYVFVRPYVYVHVHVYVCVCMCVYVQSIIVIIIIVIVIVIILVLFSKLLRQAHRSSNGPRSAGSSGSWSSAYMRPAREYVSIHNDIIILHYIVLYNVY